MEIFKVELLVERFMFKAKHKKTLQDILRSVGFCRGSRVEGKISRVEGRGSRVEGRVSSVECVGSRVKKISRQVYIKILSNNRLRLIRCLLYGKQENSFHETV